MNLRVPLYACIALLLSLNACARVLISEVIVDPRGTDSGGEAVELYNTENFPIDISGYSIMTESSIKDAVIPNGSIIRPYGFFLIADAGWSSSKDNLSWPNADYEESITLSNSDAGVALVDRNGQVLDAVGWGSSAGISDRLYEGEPLPNPEEGTSFERKPGMLIPFGGNSVDSENNSADFLIREVPEPQNSNSSAEEPSPASSITIEFSVVNTPSIRSLSLADENPTKDGIQIIPNPGGEKQIRIILNGTENSSFCGLLNFQQQSREFNFINLNGSIVSNLSMRYYEEPGNYTVRAGPCNSGYEAELSFEYEPLLAFGLDSYELKMGQISKGSSIELSGDSDFSTPERPTVANLGNRIIRLSIFSGGFEGNSSSLPPGIASFAFSESTENMTNIGEQPLDGPFLSPSKQVPLSLRIYVPPESKEGTYRGIITLSARAG